MRALLVNAYLKDEGRFSHFRSEVKRGFAATEDITYVEVNRETVKEYLYEIGSNFTEYRAE
jgi:hypothetical protein